MAFIGIDLEKRFETLDEIVAGFHALEQALYDRKDRRAVFATAYLTMTLEIEKRVGELSYNDPGWVAAYAIAFANLYRVALACYERGDRALVPEPWQISFDTANQKSNLIFQDLLLGMNAHINHDLALALEEVGLDPGREERREDHFAVNEAIRQATDAVKARLRDRYVPLYGLLDRLLGRFDEHVAGFSIEKARQNAWKSAVSLAGAESEEEHALVQRSISDNATVFARLILLPTRRSRLLKLRQIFERLTARWEFIRPGF